MCSWRRRDGYKCADQCIGGGEGLQSGLYDACDGICLAGQVAPCNGVLEASFSFNDLEIGADYYIFIDGCAGSECQFEVSIEGHEGYTLDFLEAVVVAENNCSELISNNTFCPGAELKFEVYHDGSSPPDNGQYDPPGPFDPDLDLCISWNVTPPIDGLSDFDIHFQTDGNTTPIFVMPVVTSSTEFEICAIEAWGPCENNEICDRKGGSNGQSVQIIFKVGRDSILPMIRSKMEIL